MNSNENKLDALFFIGQDTLEQIRESKKNQREITYQFIFIIGVLFGLSQILKSKISDEIIILVLKIITGVYGGATLYFLGRMQKDLSDYRRRLQRIWKEDVFKFAFEKEILDPEAKTDQYCSWRHHSEFTFIYMAMVTLVGVMVLFA